MKRKKLRELLKAPGIIRAPGAFDAWSARLVEMAGFPAVYMTGYGASASVIGKPDTAVHEGTAGGGRPGFLCAQQARNNGLICSTMPVCSAHRLIISGTT